MALLICISVVCFINTDTHTHKCKTFIVALRLQMHSVPMFCLQVCNRRVQWKRSALNGRVNEIELDTSENNYSFDMLLDHLRVQIASLIDEKISTFG